MQLPLGCPEAVRWSAVTRAEASETLRCQEEERWLIAHREAARWRQQQECREAARLPTWPPGAELL